MIYKSKTAFCDKTEAVLLYMGKRKGVGLSSHILGLIRER